MGSNNGINTFNNVVFNQVGTYTITVTDTSNSSLTATTADINVIPSVNSLSITPNKTNVIAGEPITLNVKALNASTQTDTYYRGSITFTSSAADEAVLPANYTYVALDSGNKDFINGLIFTEEGVYTVTVTDINNPSLTAESVQITVNPPPPQSDATSLDLNANKLEVFVGETVTLTVNAKDNNGEDVEDYISTVRFLYNGSPDVILPNNYMFTLEDAGVHVFNNELTFLKEEEFTVTVRDILYDSLTDTITIKVNKSTKNFLLNQVEQVLKLEKV